MKTLLLLRHAKSDWADISLRDFDRPLADRGKRDAPRIGKALGKRGPLPDLIISSPAARARQTIEAVIDSAGIDISPQFNDSVYGAVDAELIRLIRQLPDSSDCVLLVGHNPAFEQLVSRLTGTYPHMPTAALACIQFKIETWADLEDGQGKLLWLLTPKQLS